MNKALIGMDRSESFRIFLAVTTSLVEDARQVHGATPLATAALGRVLSGAGLMGLSLKNPKDKLTVQFKGDGPAGEILVTANGAGAVKGYISNPLVELPLKPNGKLDVGSAVGAGTVTVIRDMGLKEPYVGRTDIATGEIAEDFTAYFFLSEQQPSSVALGVRIDRNCSVRAAGGLIIQVLPQADDEAVSTLEKLVKAMPPISDQVERVTDGFTGGTPQAVLERLFHQIFTDLPDAFAAEVLEYRDLAWDCDCSLKRLEQVVISLGETELKKIIEEDGQAELVCQFCRSAYHFDRAHLQRLLKEAGPGASPGPKA